MRQYEQLITALAATGIPFREDGWKGEKPSPYGVYAIDGNGEDLVGDDGIDTQTLQGTVDLFTRGPGHEYRARVQRALIRSGVCWYYNSRQYEPATGYTHEEWVFEIHTDPGGEDDG